MSKKTSVLLVAGLVLVATGVVFGIFKWQGSNSGNKEHASSAEHHSEHSGTEQSTNASEIDLTSQTTVSIDIKDYAYTKANIKIKRGTTVTWTNQDTVRHNAMKEHDDGDEAHDGPTRDEVQDDVFAGPLLAKGESYSFTFNEAGSNPYHCAPHPYMKGIITVVE